MLKGKVLIAQGGGPTAVINQSLVGAVLESRKFPGVQHVYGAQHGVSGIINEDFLDLSREPTANLEAVAQTPCSALGSTRDKPDAKYCQEISRVLKAHQIDTFFYIGGNDSSDAARIVAEHAGKIGHDLTCIHIPKTVDNDLMVNDHTPGFPSAAKFVASAFAGINQDNKALKGVYVGVLMGRHAGFLTAAAAGARLYSEDGPHLIYVPERTFNMTSFLKDVKRVYNQYGRCIVAVSEGIHDAKGAPIITKLMKNIEKDAHGNVQLSGTGALADLLCDQIKAKTGITRVRGDTFGYLQRSFLGCVSDIDQIEAREVGEKAVKYAHFSGKKHGTVTIHRTGDYAVEYKLSPISAVAAKTKVMAKNMINKDGNDVTDKFMSYLKPLLGSGGLPTVSRLDQANRVKKILNKK
ncbi:MAG: 6-phosphofructokinase [Candidatus Lindowbacteria bacterium]|nr:6-phosphofructokinase [Candidatus Lindowbacteria bacterium]